MSDYALLDQAGEGEKVLLRDSLALVLKVSQLTSCGIDALHKKRLLNVEEKPFKRITKRLLTSDFVVSSPTEIIAHHEDKEARIEKWRQFCDDVALDFAAFHGSLARIQLLLTSNEKERMRYAEEKSRIEQTAQAVKENSAELRIQLAEAQKALALRKTYDVLAEKITSNRLLRPRDHQKIRLENLNAEITKLEQEREEYAKTWAERREQFGRIVEEGMQLRRLIRDEKEEVERREGMQDAEDNEESDLAPTKGRGVHQKDQLNPTEGSTQSRRGIKSATPLQQSTATSPAPAVKDAQLHDEEDENMIDEGEITSDERSPNAEQRAYIPRDEDKMDTT
ncbi:hypothetical protein KEM54_002586 [Ascosphaera aggregata]|nr:hypothetical protein KEM54_002586 [Ascosphaera aggregata]